MTGRVRSPFIWLALVAGIALLGCAQAARAFLDLPSRSAATTDASEPVAVSATPAPVREEFAAAPIESIADPDSVVSLLPRDRAGAIDWMAAEQQDIIRLRESRPGLEPDTGKGFGYDFYLWDGDGLEAFFPHSAHERYLTCQTCHPSIFRHRTAGQSLSAPHDTTACGLCHGTVAFEVQSCERCHEAVTMGEDRLTAKRPVVVSFSRSDSTAESAVAVGGSLYPAASFPHLQHRIRYRCKACHVELFGVTGDGSRLTAARAHGARGCGACHDGTEAFAAGVGACDRCHVAGDADPPP